MDTIAAIATPAGTGAVGIIRMSGDKAREIAAEVFSPYKIKSFENAQPYMMYLGRLESGGVRDKERVKAYLDSGAFRVILGTSAVKNYPFVLAAAAAFPGREVVPVDCRPLICQHGSLHCVTMQYPAGVLK